MTGPAATLVGPSARSRRWRMWRASVLAIAWSLSVTGCGSSSEVATPPSSPDAATATTAARGDVPASALGRLPAGGALLGGADVSSIPSAPVSPPAPVEVPAAAGGAADTPSDGPDAGPHSDGPDGVAALLARPGVEAVVASVVADDGAIDAWPEPPGPAGQAPPMATIPVRNEFGGPAQFRVQEQVGDWLRVQLPIRPNGSEGWIPRAEVAVAPVMHRIEVDLGARHLRVLHGGDVVLESPVAIGRPSAPTPTGSYYVRDAFAWDPYSVYGPYVLPLSAYSDSIEAINGGEAVIAIHGTNRPESVGRAASLGCLRLDNDTITALAHLVPVGTPVLITA